MTKEKRKVKNNLKNGNIKKNSKFALSKGM